MPPLSPGGIPGGARLGNAQGRVSIDVSQLQRSRTVGVAAMQQLGSEIKRSFESSTRAVNTFGQQLESTAARIRKVRGEIVAVAAAGAAWTVLGLNAADNMQAVNIRLRAITGSQERANVLMERLETSARRFSLPIIATQTAMAGLITVLPDGTRNLERWTGLVARLATLNQREGIAGSVFAIREAISSGGTDLVSLSERFNIPRKRLRELIEETGSFEAALDRVLNEMGATTVAAEEMGQTWGAAISRFTDSLGRAAGVGIAPFVSRLVDMADSATAFFEDVQKNNPALLEFASGLGLIAAAGGPLLIFLGQAITSLRTIASILPGLGGLGRLGVGGAALAVGGFIGKEIVQTIGEVPGNNVDPRLRRDSGEDFFAVLGERLKQAIIGAADTIVSFAGIMAAGGFVVRNGFEQVGNAIALGVKIIENSFGKLETAIGQVLVDLGLRFRNQGLIDTGVGLLDSGSRRQSESSEEIKHLRERLSEGLGLTELQQRALREATERMREIVVGGLNDMLFPAQETAEALTDTGDALDEVTEAFHESAEFLEDQAKELVDATRQYNEDVKQIEERGRQERLDIEKKYADRQVEIAEAAADAAEKALEGLIDKRDELRRDLGREEEKAERDARARELDELIDFQRDEAKAARDHARRMRDILRQSEEQEEDLISNRQFGALLKLRRDTSRRLEEENIRFADERQERQIAYADQISDLRRQFERERQERQIKFWQDIYDASVAYHAEQKMLEENRVKDLARAQAARDADSRSLATKIAQELKMRALAFREELKLIAMGSQARLDIERQFLIAAVEQARAILGNAFNDLYASVQTAPAGGGGGGHPDFSSKALGGPLSIGQNAIVNDAFRGQRESFRSGGRGAMFPDSLGLFMPLKAGTVDAGGGGTTVQFNQTNHITTGKPELAADLIVRKTKEVLKDYFGD